MIIDSITFDGKGNVTEIRLKKGVKYDSVEEAIDKFIDSLTKEDDYGATVKWKPPVGRLGISKGDAKDGTTYYEWNFRVWVTPEDIHYIINNNASGFTRGKPRDKYEKAIEEFVINECEQPDFTQLTYPK